MLSFSILPLMVSSNTILVRNVMRFYEIRNQRNRSFELNSNIKQVSIGHIYQVSIDRKLLHELVFEQIYELTLVGTFGSFESDLLKKFSKLRVFILTISNMREFIHASDNLWMSSLDYHSKNISEVVNALKLFPQTSPKRLLPVHAS